MPARTAARPRSRATASARSASRPSCARRSRRCPCSGWTPTQAAARAASPRSSSASRRRLPASSWAPRWSRRATTSRTWSWPSSRTPTRTCGSPTSGPRSARSRSVAQLAGRSGRGPAGGRVLVQTLCPSAASLRHAAAHDAAGFLAEEVERRRALRYPPFSTLIRVLAAAPDQAVCRRGGGAARHASAGAARRRPRRARPRAAVPCQGPVPLHAGDEDRRPARPPSRPSARRCSRSPRERTRRGVKLAVDVDPQ